MSPLKYDDSMRGQWCGPVVIALITRKPIGDVLQAVERVCRNNEEEFDGGTYIEHLQMVLYELGYACTPLDLTRVYPELTQGPTIQRFVSELTMAERYRPIILAVPGHWVVTHLGYVMDNNHTPKPANEWRRVTVQQAFVVRELTA